MATSPNGMATTVNAAARCAVHSSCVRHHVIAALIASARMPAPSHVSATPPVATTAPAQVTGSSKAGRLQRTAHGDDGDGARPVPAR